MLATAMRPMLMATRPAVTPLRLAAAPCMLGAPSLRAGGTWAAWAAYIGIVLLSEGGIAPGNSALHTEPATIIEAVDLSLNFWFVLPTIASGLAPYVDPSLEAFFNVLICYALLFFGFTADERENEYTPGGMVPYLTGALFLTNVFYLPMLAIRTPRTPADRAASEALPLTPLQRLAESKLIAAVVGIAVPLLALGWLGYGRAELVPTTGLEARVSALVNLVQTDRLAFSFFVDYLVFAAFQGALVQDDARRRGVDVQAAGVRAAQYVPFAGLVGWLLTRPALTMDE